MKKTSSARSLYIKAGKTIMSCFKDTAELVYFFAHLADKVNDFNSCYTFAGANKDSSIDAHYAVITTLHSMTTASIAGTDDAICKAIDDILCAYDADDYHQRMLRAYSAQIWYHSCISSNVDREEVQEATRVFTGLLEASILMYEAQKIESKENKL